MKTKEEILENCLNDIGFSFAEQLKPDNITLAEVRKTKKAILKAMEEYAQQFTDKAKLREELIKYETWASDITERSDKETTELMIDEYLQSKANVCTTKDLDDSERK